MQLPSIDELNAITKVLVASEVRYIDLAIDQRVIVLDLALKASVVEQLYDISCDLRDVGAWFKNSRLFDGI